VDADGGGAALAVGAAVVTGLVGAGWTGSPWPHEATAIEATTTAPVAERRRAQKGHGAPSTTWRRQRLHGTRG